MVKLSTRFANKINHLNLATSLAKKLLAKGKTELARQKLEVALKTLEPSLPAKTNLKLLVVEDVDNERELLAGLLRMHDYEVQSLGDGLETLRYLQNNPLPDVILIDMHLPELDGDKTIKHIRSNQRYDQVKIIALSGCSSEAFNLDLGANRVAKWFTKPIQPDYLVSEVGRLATA